MARSVRESVTGEPDGVQDEAPPEWARDATAGEGATVEVPAQGGEVEAAAPALMALTNWLVDTASRSDEDDWAAMEKSVARILNNEGSAEDILKQDLPISGKGFLNRAFLIHGFTLTESDHEEGMPFYANLDVTLAMGGERRILNVGGTKVLAKLMMLDRLGEWPLPAMLVGTETKKGHLILDIVKPEI